MVEYKRKRMNTSDGSVRYYYTKVYKGGASKRVSKAEYMKKISGKNNVFTIVANAAKFSGLVGKTANKNTNTIEIPRTFSKIDIVNPNGNIGTANIDGIEYDVISIGDHEVSKDEVVLEFIFYLSYTANNIKTPKYVIIPTKYVKNSVKNDIVQPIRYKKNIITLNHFGKFYLKNLFALYLTQNDNNSIKEYTVNKHSGFNTHPNLKVRYYPNSDMITWEKDHHGKKSIISMVEPIVNNNKIHNHSEKNNRNHTGHSHGSHHSLTKSNTNPTNFNKLVQNIRSAKQSAQQ